MIVEDVTSNTERTMPPANVTVGVAPKLAPWMMTVTGTETSPMGGVTEATVGGDGKGVVVGVGVSVGMEVGVEVAVGKEVGGSLVGETLVGGASVGETLVGAEVGSGAGVGVGVDVGSGVGVDAGEGVGVGVPDGRGLGLCVGVPATLVSIVAVGNGTMTIGSVVTNRPSGVRRSRSNQAGTVRTPGLRGWKRTPGN